MKTKRLCAIMQALVQFPEDGVKPRWGTFCKCLNCGGYTAISTDGAQVPEADNGFVRDPIVATMLAMFAHGYRVALWEKEGVRSLNRFEIPYPCLCPCRHEWVEKTIGNCLHEATCRKCGSQVAYDSSD